MASKVVVERTAKRWKLLKLLSVVLLFVGILLLVVSADSPRDQPFPPVRVVGMGLLASSVGAFVLARLGAWWNHS